MKSLEQKIEERAAELKEVKKQRAENSARQNAVYSSLEQMYDESGYDLEDYTTLQTSKECLVKRGVELHKQEEKLVKKLTKLVKRRKTEPNDELKQLLNLN